MIDHEAVAREKMTEKYLLDELDPLARDEFEAHYFDCPECALDVRAGSALVEELKRALKQTRETEEVGNHIHPNPWLAWLRPVFTVPALALLLVVIGVQSWQMRNPRGQPQVLPWAAVNVGTYGSGAPVITAAPGEGFLLFVRIPPGGDYARYTADLQAPDGKVQWSLTIPADSAHDQWPIQVPGANRESGELILSVHGINTAGESREVGKASFVLQIQK